MHGLVILPYFDGFTKNFEASIYYYIRRDHESSARRKVYAYVQLLVVNPLLI